jgi:predicted MFS family arabinose efflux permease
MGRKGAMLLALTLFGMRFPRWYVLVPSLIVLAGIGTIGCGIAPSMETLIIARAIAGMGGGG